MRLRTKFLFLFLGSGLFLLLEALAAAWSLSYVGGDVDNLQAYTQTDDMCGQLKAELAQVPDLDVKVMTDMIWAAERDGRFVYAVHPWGVSTIDRADSSNVPRTS